MLYLIAHKVRGETTFDIAVRDGEDWINPTSCCKVYPYWERPLKNILDLADIAENGSTCNMLEAILNTAPSDCRDYQRIYIGRTEKTIGAAELDDLLKDII